MAVQSPFQDATASAPGKVILFGEHAVVHGYTAIAASVSDLRVVVSARPVDSPTITVTLTDLASARDGCPFKRSWALADLDTVMAKCMEQPDSFVQELAEALGELSFDARVLSPVLFLIFRIWRPACLSADLRGGIELTARSGDLPVGAGLGSSAAFSVATAGALLHACRKFTVVFAEGKEDQPKLTKEDLSLANGLAFEAERIMHGNPSGLDNTVSAFGGAIVFKKGAPFEPLKGLPTVQMLITDTGVPRETKRLVASVEALYKKFPAATAHMFNAIQSLSERYIEEARKLENEGPEEGDHEGSRSTIASSANIFEETLQDMVRMNQGLLHALGVSHISIDKVREITEGAGMATKLTGAGGGGCCLSIVPRGACEKLNQVKEQLQNSGFRSFETKLGGIGLQIQSEAKL